MPVFVESVTSPDSADQNDLVKIYNDAPEWLTSGLPAEEWVSNTLATNNLHLFAGRFNDRFLTAAVISERDLLWELEWLNVRKVTRDRGVGLRMINELQRIAHEHGRTLVMTRETEGDLPSYLQKLRMK
ncbi:acetyl-CoA sensor PanZ family protein [Parendozoicomonas haliclonae]|uniref:Acetyltransferase, GNAT family n=1 Tax=Parendozoicomonas haliclonae TaxID=1960125 RepID=A0A1X7APY1_9GAMM|nr:acetyl-CoA sensor PanZ family protein [Parendozoicomonas haliclonae]SMA50160.1 Acetyltransferase, GNAT family [Parendozoicomonas haliclonae]